MTSCPICDARAIGRTWTRNIIMGNQTVGEAALFFNMDINAVNDHVNNHEIVENAETGQLTSPDMVMNELLRIFNNVRDWTDVVTRDGRLDRNTIDLCVKLSKEARETIKTIAELQGRFSETNSTQQITLIKNNYMMLTEVIVKGVCDKCRGKIVEVLDKQNAQLAPAKP